MFRHSNSQFIYDGRSVASLQFNITPPPPLLSMLTVRDRVKTLQFSYSFCHHYLGERNKEQNNRFIRENLHQSYQD